METSFADLPTGQGKSTSVRHWIAALVGAFVINVVLSAALLSWRHPDFVPFASSGFKYFREIAEAIGGLWLLGGILLSRLVYLHLSRVCESYGLSRLAASGALIGAAIAFANVPFCIAALFADFPRGVVLLASTGAMSGLWIAWHAYRSNHPEAGFFPRYHLSTLLMLVVVWGAVLTVFSPDRTPAKPPPRPISVE